MSRDLLPPFFHDSHPSGSPNYFAHVLKFAEMCKKLRDVVSTMLYLNLKKAFFSTLKRQFHEIVDTVFYASNSTGIKIDGLKHFCDEVQGFQDISQRFLTPEHCLCPRV